MTEAEKRKYQCTVASITDADGFVRFRPIIDLRRDELLAAYCSLQTAYMAAQEQLKEAGYPSG